MSSIKFRGNPCNVASVAHAERRTNGHTNSQTEGEAEMWKVTGDIRDCSNASIKMNAFKEEVKAVLYENRLSKDFRGKNGRNHERQVRRMKQSTVGMNK